MILLTYLDFDSIGSPGHSKVIFFAIKGNSNEVYDSVGVLYIITGLPKIRKIVISKAGRNKTGAKQINRDRIRVLGFNIEEG
jgi:hypothetical protein